MKMKTIVLLTSLMLFFALSVEGRHHSGDCDQICVPNSVFFEECNRCECSADGKSKICTEIFCGDVYINDKGPPKVPSYQNCYPGSTYMVDCNTCTCADDGSGPVACTEIAC